MFNLSSHSITRAAQRNLSAAEIEYIVAYGHRYHKAGAVIYYLRKRDIPGDDRSVSEIARLEGTALIFSRDEELLLTVWRNRRKGLSTIRRKPKYRFA